jgi:hypothetical protein
MFEELNGRKVMSSKKFTLQDSEQLDPKRYTKGKEYELKPWICDLVLIDPDDKGERSAICKFRFDNPVKDVEKVLPKQNWLALTIKRVKSLVRMKRLLIWPRLLRNVFDGRLRGTDDHTRI